MRDMIQRLIEKSSKKLTIRSAKVAFIVGSLLNVINQGGAIWAGADPDIFRGALTYCVPFCVSYYAAIFMNPS